ncbi:MAG: rhodanese-related sulfurtransferase [Chitinophagales bacterium]
MKPFRTLLYYKYVRIPNAEEVAARHLAFCERIGLKGRIIIAPEGLNGTVSGTIVQCQKYIDYCNQHPLFSGIDFKADDVDEVSFNALHVRCKDEIVNSGTKWMKDVDPTKRTGIHLEPAEFASMKDEEDVVILDVRSNYESNLGRFKNAIAADIDNFRDFPEEIKKYAHLKDKKVLTYCTGGIKCEKASALLLEHGFKNVYQLHGGIVKYGKEVGGKDFDGACYVFDKRISVPVNTINPTVISNCKKCGTPSTHMINCANPDCNEHFVLCESCGWEMKGCCSEACMQAPECREYDGTGYYSRY